MKRIKSRRQMAAGIIALVLALLCFAVLLLAGYQARFLAAGVLALAWSAVSFSLAFSQKGTAEEIAAQADERDIYLAMKSGHTALRILTYTLWGGCLGCLVLYGGLKLPVLLHAAITLCAVQVLLFFITLGQIYTGKSGDRTAAFPHVKETAPRCLLFRSPDLWDIFSPSPA